MNASPRAPAAAPNRFEMEFGALGCVTESGDREIDESGWAAKVERGTRRQGVPEFVSRHDSRFVVGTEGDPVAVGGELVEIGQVVTATSQIQERPGHRPAFGGHDHRQDRGDTDTGGDEMHCSGG